MGTSLFLGALACLLGLFGRARLALLLGFTALVWLLVWSLPAVSVGFRAQLEADYPPVAMDAVPAAGAIVVLGGGINAPGTGYPNADLGSAADRTWHAARLFRAGKAPLIVLSGGTDPTQNLASEAAAMRILLLDLGVPEAAMVLEERSRTTEENASFSAAILHQRGVKSVLLVTSALHMRRASQHWEHRGLQVHPVATDHEARPVAAWRIWIPDTGALEASARAIKEWFGGRMFNEIKGVRRAAP
ncbi:MAG: YdcF family protein [Pseudomonadota bacterium]